MATMACPPSDGVQWVCGPRAAEDLVRIPGTPWLLAGGLATDRPAAFYAIDHRTKQARPVFPVTGATTMRLQADWRAICPGPPNLARLSVDGLALRASDRYSMLYAANHGDRRAVEVFRVDVAKAGPKLSWIGCVPMPKGTLANAIAALSDGGLVVTSFHDPDDPDAWKKLAKRETTGGVWEWHAASGWKSLDVGPVSGPNGVALSADERTLYVSAWADRRLLAIERGHRVRREIVLDFLPDNLRRDDDGSLLLAGQRAKVSDIAVCQGPVCPQPWVVVRVEPARAKFTTLAEGPGSPVLSYACGALRIDDVLYVSARAQPGVAWVSLKALPP